MRGRKRVKTPECVSGISKLKRSKYAKYQANPTSKISAAKIRTKFL